MAEKLNIYQKLSKIQTELKAPKNLFNKFGNYKYRNAEGILEALKPYLDKYNAAVIIKDNVEVIGERYYIRATAILIDDDSKEMVEAYAYARESLEKKGMDASQVTGATSSYARKYALNGLFLLDDTKDADTDEYTERTTGVKPKSQAKEQTEAKPTAAELKKLNQFVDAYADTLENANLSDIWALLKKKYNFESTKDLTKEKCKKATEQVEAWYKKSKEGN